MAFIVVRRFLSTVLKWLIPVPPSRPATTRTGAFLDLPRDAGYRANEMLSRLTFRVTLQAPFAGAEPHILRNRVRPSRGVRP